MRDFLFGHTRVWNWDLWISSPALYHCTTVTSSFHLWQFQVFNSGAEGLVVVLFWLDLWEIFFLATPGFEPRNSGSLVLHSTTAPQWLLVFTSDNFRYLTLVQRDWWWYCSDWTCERFSFWPHWGLNPGISGSLVLHSTIAPWWLLVFTSDNFRYLTLVQRDMVVVLFWLDLWEIFFLATLGFEPRTSGSLVLHSTTVPLVNSGFHLWQFQVFNSGAEGLVVVLFWLDLWEIFFLATQGFEPRTYESLVLHSTTVPQWLLVFTSDNFRYLTLVQRDWWWYCSDWTCERFSFLLHRGLNPGLMNL